MPKNDRKLIPMGAKKAKNFDLRDAYEHFCDRQVARYAMRLEIERDELREERDDIDSVREIVREREQKWIEKYNAEKEGEFVLPDHISLLEFVVDELNVATLAYDLEKAVSGDGSWVTVEDYRELKKERDELRSKLQELKDQVGGDLRLCRICDMDHGTARLADPTCRTDMLCSEHRDVNGVIG